MLFLSELLWVQKKKPKASELKAGAILLEKEIEIVKTGYDTAFRKFCHQGISYIPWAKEVVNFKKCGFYDVNGYKIGFVTILRSGVNRKEIKESLKEFSFQ